MRFVAKCSSYAFSRYINAMKHKIFLLTVSLLGLILIFGILPSRAQTKSANTPLKTLSSEDIKVRFLGTGAADWKAPDQRGEYRRLSSILIDDSVLIDLTPSALDMLPSKLKVKYIFYTHSHGDHFKPSAALEAGVECAHLSETWSDRARKKLDESIEIVPLKIGQKVSVAGLDITALPANHMTSDSNEQALIYLIEKGRNRILYATDTGGIMARAARLAGIDAHTQGRPINGLIMEATMGMDHDEDFRIYTHSSALTVLRIYHVLKKTNRYVANADQPVFITHLARTLHPSQKELDATLPSPLKAAYDGLEYVFKPVEK